MIKTIDEVIEHLNEIIEWSKTNSSRMGYYAALYRSVTLRIKEAIDNKEFQDNIRLENLDTIFATLYVNAFESYITTGECQECWKFAFHQSNNPRLTILQHLVISTNVHINFDLTVALVRASKNANLTELKDDFDKINSILHGLVDHMANKIAHIWGRTGHIEQLIGKIDKVIITFMMGVSRKRAWKQAERLSKLRGDQLEHEIAMLDLKVSRIGKIVTKARILASMPFWFRKNGEQGAPAEIISQLE